MSISRARRNQVLADTARYVSLTSRDYRLGASNFGHMPGVLRNMIPEMRAMFSNAESLVRFLLVNPAMSAHRK